MIKLLSGSRLIFYYNGINLEIPMLTFWLGRKMKNFKFYISLLIFTLILQNSYSQFVLQYTPVKKNLYQIFFSDNDYGFVIGEEGTLLKTINGGVVWMEIDLHTDDDLSDVYFFNQDSGFVIGENNTFLRTYNGGKEWSKIKIPVQADLTAMKFIDNVGYVIGHGYKGGVFLKTTDYGNTWSCKIINEECLGKNTKLGFDCDDIYLTNLSFVNEKEGIIGGFSYNYNIGKKAFLCKTMDGGETFTDISPNTDANSWNQGYEIIAVNYITEHDAYAVLNTGRGNSCLFISDYQVKYFEQLNNQLIHDYHELYFSSWFLDRYVGYFTCLVQGKSQIMKTIDLGESFMFLNPPTNNTLYGSFFINSRNGYFVGQSGTILHLTDNNNAIYSGEYANEELFIDPPFSIATPNSRTTRTHIHVYNLSIEDTGDIEVSLFNKFGSEIEVKRSRIRKYSDEIRMKIRTEELTYGTYFYTIKEDNQTLISGKIDIGNLAHILY